MSLQRISGLVLCLMVLFVMGCGSGSDSPAGDRTGGGGTEAGSDSGSTGGNGTGDGVVDAPGDGGDTEDPDLGDDMVCEIGTTYMAEPDGTTGGVPEPEVDDVETSDSSSNSDDISTTNPGDGAEPDPLEGMVRIAGMDEDVTDLKTDAYRIEMAGDDAPVIMDDVLTVTLSRSGGCPDEEHEFTLVAGHEFWGGDPVELDFTIIHDNKGDMCERDVRDQVEFYLTEIKARYKAAYPEGDGVMLVFEAPDGSVCDSAGLLYDLD